MAGSGGAGVPVRAVQEGSITKAKLSAVRNFLDGREHTMSSGGTPLGAALPTWA